MRIALLAAALILWAQLPACGYGSIAWTEVRTRIAPFDPLLLKMIEQQFKIDRFGGGQMPAHSGNERIAPYTFYATRISTGKRYRLDFDESDDFEFTKRWKVTWWIDSPEPSRKQ